MLFSAINDRTALITGSTRGGESTARISLAGLTTHGYRTGLIRRCTQMMAAFYAKQLGFDQSFESETAIEMGRFVRSFDLRVNAFFYLLEGDEVVGCGALDGRAMSGEAPGVAQLRWMYIEPAARGRGLGAKMLSRALAFARLAGHARVVLSMHDKLASAIRLYEAAGFRRTGIELHDCRGRLANLAKDAVDLPRAA